MLVVDVDWAEKLEMMTTVEVQDQYWDASVVPFPAQEHRERLHRGG